MHRFLLAITLATAGILGPFSAGVIAQDRYPIRPIRLVVASAPGGVT